MKKTSLILFICLASLAFAGGPKEKCFMLRGKVTDSRNNEALAGVKVSIKGRDFSTYTDFDGNYILMVPAGAACTINFEMLSYEGSNAEVQSQSGNELNITLKERE